MATRFPQTSNDLRRQVGSSPRPKGRGAWSDNTHTHPSSASNPTSAPNPSSSSSSAVSNSSAQSQNTKVSFREDRQANCCCEETKDTLCRNILIYGHCRYEDQGCTFNHDQNKGAGSQSDAAKKSLNVESPSFTPASLQPTGKKVLASTAASAPAFTPRGIGSATPVASEPDTASFNPAAIREFTPSFELSSSSTNGTPQDGAVSYDPFTMPSVGQGMQANPYNPYAEDHSGIGTASSAFYQAQSFAAPLQPLQYHLYAPIGPYRGDIMPYHRLTHDFFLPEKVREELQKKSEATLQVMPNSQLPQLDNYHSLVALDITQRKNANLFGYPSWVYKATSTKTGNTYCLRRLEGYRLTNEHAIRSVKEWRQISSASVVTIHDAFTTRAFGDSSLIFVQDYHPLSKTLAEVHLSQNTTQGQRFQAKTGIPEPVLWAYISQIVNAIKAIHSANLAARCIDLTKIILTDKNRVRLTACSILDVVNFDSRRTLQELQQEDFLQFGRAILCLATNTLPAHLTNLKASMDQLSRIYSVELRDTVIWLLSPQQPPAQKGIDEFIRGISTHMLTSLDASLHRSDEITSDLARELENGRVARLVMKLGTINERADFDGDRAWSENGERYMLKLFRDYVFHQVDGQGAPVLDAGHMLRCLNKLDAGVDELICLTSRDEQTSFLVSYKELKKQLANAFGELQKGTKVRAHLG